MIEKFTYVNLVGKGCEGWLNLFIGEYVLCLVNNIELADKIRSSICEKSKSCKCSMVTQLVGDGCEICNPVRAKEIEDENKAELSANHRG